MRVEIDEARATALADVPALLHVWDLHGVTHRLHQISCVWGLRAQHGDHALAQELAHLITTEHSKLQKYIICLTSMFGNQKFRKQTKELVSRIKRVGRA